MSNIEMKVSKRIHTENTAKKLSNIFEEICSLENIEKAGIKAAKDKKYQPEVIEYKKNADFYNQEIVKMLINGTYKVTEDDYIIYRKITSSGKERLLKKLPFYPFRIVQHAILNVTEKRWVKSLTYDSYNCIKGRGINSRIDNHNYSKKLKRALRDPYSDYVLVLDIEDFYGSVNNRIHAKTYRRDIKDKRALKLMDMHNFSTNGLAIGSPDSQMHSHLELRKLDRFIKQELKAKYYFRYADDIVILSDSKEELNSWMWRIMNFLYYNNRLIIKGNRRIFPVSEGIDVCGSVFYPTHTGLRKRIKKNIVKKRHNAKSMASYNGILKHCNSKNFQELVIKNNNRHMDITQTGIKLERKFSGELIAIAKVVDETISILDFEVRDSTKNKGGYWLMMQILYRGEKRFMKGGYSLICAWLLQFKKEYIGDKDTLTAEEYEAKKREVLPLRNVVIKENQGYYFEGTIK